MRKIVNYVVASVDGFIAGPDDDISGFIQQGKWVGKYLQDLKTFCTLILGRKTYEFGLLPEQPTYPHKEHYIFSSMLTFDHPHEKMHVGELKMQKIKALKNQQGAYIYLYGEVNWRDVCTSN